MDDERERLEIDNRKKKLERTQKLNVSGIVRWTKRFVGVVVSSLIIFGLYKFIMLCVNSDFNIDWRKVKVLTRVILIIGGVIYFVYCIINIIEDICNYYAYDADMKWYAYPVYWLFLCIKHPFMWIWFVIKHIWIFISEGFKFLFGYFKATKDNYCPGIIWTDDNTQ